MVYKNREDQRAYGRQHYLDNKDKYRATAEAQRVKQTADRKQKIKDYLASHPCIDCGESDPIVLDFDHRDASQKKHNVSRMWRSRYSWGKILEEIEKCDIRCANCHRRRTAIQFGWLE